MGLSDILFSSVYSARICSHSVILRAPIFVLHGGDRRL